MRAALMERGRIWVDTIDAPTPGPGEVLVRTLWCGICGSDLHAAEHTEEFVATSRAAGGAFKLVTLEPVVLGHEFSAEVLDYGPETTREPATGGVVCSVPMLLRAERLPVGYSAEIPGGFAEYMVLSQRLLCSVPPGTPSDAAALTEPLAVGLHAVRKARVLPGDAALVLGAGPVGLAVVAALSHAGVAPIVASDFSPKRRELALRMGAHEAVDPAAASPWERPELRRPKNVVIFECIGVPGILDDIFVAAPRNARIVVVGVCLQMDHSRPLVAINKELSVQYVLGYTIDEFAETLGRIAEGAVNVVPLITGRIGLDGVADAFTALRDPEAHAKILVEPGRT